VSGFDERYLRRLATSGKVYSTLDEDGVRLFDIDELKARRHARENAKTNDAALDAKAIELFEAGVAPMDAVVQLGVTLSRVTTIYTAWRRLRAARQSMGSTT
jgi:hypothetical protein